MNRAKLMNLVLDYSFLGLIGTGGAVDVVEGHVPVDSLALWSSFQVAIAVLRSASLKRHTGSSKLSEKRWSVFSTDQQPDRYLALNGLSRVSKIIDVGE